MNPTPIICFAAGLLAGALLTWLLHLIQLRNYVSRTTANQQQADNTALQLRLAACITPDQLAQQYTPTSLYNALHTQLQQAHATLETARQQHQLQQTQLLDLTAAAEQKLSPATVARDYVSRDTFDVIRHSLSTAQALLEDKQQHILQQSRQLEALQQRELVLNEKLATFNTEVLALHTRSEEQFKNLANTILEEKRAAFIKTNQTELSTILSPLKTDLDTFKKTVEDTRKEDIRDLTSLKKEIESLQKLNVQLSDDAKNLAQALQSDVKVQGSWGEDRLQLILEKEGLQPHIDYHTQGVYVDEEQNRNRKPDFILHLPNDKHLIIDSKVSLTAYVNYANASTPEAKALALRQHLKSVTDHIDLLADKNYQSLAGLQSPDYVFLFMPIESAITLALNEQPDIFNRALNKKIILITPTTLVATLKIIKLIWQKENQVKNVQEIFRQCGLLYDKFVSFLEEMDRVGTGLHTANKAYKEATDRLKEGARKGDTIIGKFETIRKLEARTNKRIPERWTAGLDLPQEEESLATIKQETPLPPSTQKAPKKNELPQEE